VQWPVVVHRCVRIAEGVLLAHYSERMKHRHRDRIGGEPGACLMASADQPSPTRLQAANEKCAPFTKGGTARTRRTGCGRHTTCVSVADGLRDAACAICCRATATARRCESLRGYPRGDWILKAVRTVEAIHEIANAIRNVARPLSDTREDGANLGRTYTVSGFLRDTPFTGGSSGSDGGAAHATPASETDMAPAAITATNACLIISFLPTLSSRNDGEPPGRFRAENRRSRTVRRTQ
jgi:hypothetical protein